MKRPGLPCLPPCLSNGQSPKIDGSNAPRVGLAGALDALDSMQPPWRLGASISVPLGQASRAVTAEPAPPPPPRRLDELMDVPGASVRCTVAHGVACSRMENRKGLGAWWAGIGYLVLIQKVGGVGAPAWVGGPKVWDPPPLL